MNGLPRACALKDYRYNVSSTLTVVRSNVSISFRHYVSSVLRFSGLPFPYYPSKTKVGRWRKEVCLRQLSHP